MIGQAHIQILALDPLYGGAYLLNFTHKDPVAA